MPYQFDPENPFRTEQKQPETTIGASETMGLKVEHFFSTPGTHPFEQLEWETRSAKITGDDGKAIFEQGNIEGHWSWADFVLQWRAGQDCEFTEVCCGRTTFAASGQALTVLYK